MRINFPKLIFFSSGSGSGKSFTLDFVSEIINNRLNLDSYLEEIVNISSEPIIYQIFKSLKQTTEINLSPYNTNKEFMFSLNISFNGDYIYDKLSKLSLEVEIGLRLISVL